MKNDPAKPVGFRQDRIGEFGKLIKMYKLRTMVVGAEDMLEDVLEQGFEKDGFSPEKNDPRVTSYGRPLRDSHVDEFPQLINILSGDMSIVGNRPVSYHEIRRIAFENGELKKTLLAINVYMHQAAQ